MRIHFVTRHPGALHWARAQRVPFDRCTDHIEPEEIAPGDVVVGVLSLGLAAALCERGARVFGLTLNMPRELRGQELDAEQLAALQAHLQEFEVRGGLSGAAAVHALRALGAHDKVAGAAESAADSHTCADPNRDSP